MEYKQEAFKFKVYCIVRYHDEDNLSFEEISNIFDEPSSLIKVYYDIAGECFVGLPESYYERMKYS